jgi:hypothetical protein
MKNNFRFYFRGWKWFLRSDWYGIRRDVYYGSTCLDIGGITIAWTCRDHDVGGE